MKTKLTVAVLVAATALALCTPAMAGDSRVVVRGFESHRPSMSLHLSGTGLTLGDDAIDPEGAANLGGIGLSWRWDLVDWGGLEISLATVGRRSDNDLVQETRGVFTAAWLWYFARHHSHRFYGITGITGMGTELDIGETHYSYGEGGFTLGIGSEWMMGRNWVVSVDARAHFLEADHEEAVTVTEGAPAPDNRARRPYPVEWWTPPAERTAAQFNVGIGYRW